MQAKARRERIASNPLSLLQIAAIFGEYGSISVERSNYQYF
jgi:hypothetical protein